MKKYLLIIAILTLSFSAIQAQDNKEIDIIGLVQNEAGESLVGATIASYKNKQLISGTATAANGIYELITKGEEIEISYLGYQSIKENVAYFQDNPVITMKEAATDLDLVVVTALNIDSRRICKWGCGSSIINEREPQPIELNIGFNPTTWQVYPNPTMERITVNTVFSTGAFSLLSSDGRLLKKIPVYERSMDIDLNEYPAGSYFLRYESDHWSETFGPIVKLKN